MRSLDLEPILEPIKAAIAQTLDKAQLLNQPVILSYSWNYQDFCQDEKQDRKQVDKVTPISLLAHAGGGYKFYWQQKITLAAIGMVASMDIDSSQNRFDSAKLFCQKYLTNSVTKGDTALGLIPTYALGGFAFHDRPRNKPLDKDIWQGFPNAMLFIPKWLLQQNHTSPLVITLNHCIDPEDILEELEKLVSDRILKFSNEFPNLVAADNITEYLSHTDRDIQEVTGDRPWIEVVEEALSLIKLGKLEKVVLARALDVHSRCSDLEVLNSLRQNYPECISFLLNLGSSSFVGATPEILLQFHSDLQSNQQTDNQNLYLESEAIAGSTRRGLTTSEDRLLGDILMSSLKDRYEHEIVIKSICDRLQDLGVELAELATPKLKRLKNVQHLYTEITGILKNSHWLQSFEILRQLHPTPAVGGEPQELAVHIIQASEACDRGWYAAPIGWVNSDGAGVFAVGIRSGCLNGESARIYAGAGIVADSDIASELGETAIKFEALLKALDGSFR